AEEELTAAGEALDAWRATLTDRELRVWAFQASASDESDRNSSVARVVAALAGGGRVAPAFALAERRRARELGDRMLGAASWRTGGTAGRGGGGEQEGGRAAYVSQGEIAALIPDDQTALIEFVTGAQGAPTTAFVVTRKHTAGGGAVRLAPADSLTGEIARFVALVARGEAAEAEGAALGALLLAPVLARMPAGVTRLVIVPDGPLHRVPWDALRLPNRRYLVERYTIALAPSAGVLAALWNRPPTARAPGGLASVLAFGDPEFSPDTGGYAAVFAAHGGLPRLRGSGREARNVALHSDHGQVRLRSAATAEYLLGNPMDGYGVIHLATHAVVDDRAISGTALALAPGGSDDGFVTPGDLASLRLDADVVVLSACRTAGGVVVDGEGIQGLTAPLLQAGARSVVATSWRVRDRSTVKMVNGFYEELAAGKPVAEALRAAKLAAIERGEAPAVWAAFTVVGDPLTVVPLQSTGSTGGSRLTIALVAATGLLAATLAASLAYQRRGRRGRKDEARGSDPSVTSRTHQR
ncbi:MAG: CHAT domain-containing protein, partial [Gemmatimonadales bacterium]